MTQYWFRGEKLKIAEQDIASTDAQNEQDEEDPDSLDISVVNQDTLVDPILKAITEEEANKAAKKNADERWILIELDMNQADVTNEKNQVKESTTTFKAKKELIAKNKEEKQNVELVVNLYGTSGNSSSLVSSNEKRTCPVGSFDCNMDGLQCIPNSLRQVKDIDENLVREETV